MKHKVSDEDPINPEELNAYNAWRRSQGLPIVPVKLPKNAHTIYVSDDAWYALDRLAMDFGFTHGRGGNISELMEAVGQGIVEVRHKDV